jgi:hypothetical protein
MIVDGQPQRAQDRHAARGGAVQIFAHCMFEHRDVDDAIGAHDPDPAGEIADRCRRHTELQPSFARAAVAAGP